MYVSRTGPWRVVDEGEARYNVSVQGASSVELEVSLYHTDTDTGVAQLVHDTPTAGESVSQADGQTVHG